MTDWKTRLRDTLEPILSKEDPRPDISAYRDMPLCIFLYDPSCEFALRQELSLLKTRLEHKGKRITIVSLMDCMMEALEQAGVTIPELVENEKMLGKNGHKTVAQTIHQVLSEYAPLDQMVLSKVPQDGDPHRGHSVDHTGRSTLPLLPHVDADRTLSSEAGDPRRSVLPRRNCPASRP